MNQKDTPPSSPDMDNDLDEEDIVYVGDVDEVLDAFDHENENDNEAMEEDVLIVNDASCVFTGHKHGSVFCGSLNKTGTVGASGGEEDKAYVWDASTGNVLFECTGHKDSVIFAEFNHDDTYLATGDMSGIIQVWRLSDYNRVWEDNIGDVTWMKWHAAANLLFAGCVNGEVYMWKVPAGQSKVFPHGHGCRAETATIFPDGKRIVVGYEDGTIRVIDLRTGVVLSLIRPRVGHSAIITTLDCHTDNNIILSAAVDGKTVLSTAQTGMVVRVLQNLKTEANSDYIDVPDHEGCHSNWVETAAFCKDPTFDVAATGTLNGEIFIWDIPKQALRQKISQESGISKLLWKGDTSLLFSAGLDGVLRCYDAKASQCLQSFTGHTSDILDVYLSGNGNLALTTSDDSTARIFNIASITQ